jgi:formylglycine-generating enzyme required for sulfatase activity
MPFIVHTLLGQQIKLEDKPFQTGGEGALYKIVTPYNLTNHCVKLYYQQYQNDQRESKLKYMVNHKPPTLTDSSNIKICWATDVVYRQDKFIGFVMPLAFVGSIQLYELCTTKIKKNIDEIWHQKFDRSKSDTLSNRLKLCVNIAIAIHNIHLTKNYVLVDMKPQNILVTPEGKVSIVDLDSLQIAENGNVIHQGQVATPEYVPVEGNRLNPAVHFIPATWDRFSLSIIFYELIFGLHPFVATSTGIYENITTIDESIKNGLFVYGAKSQYLQLPPPHNNFNLLPQKMKDCFMNALDKGHNNPNARPTAEEWGKVIFAELKTSVTPVSSIRSQPPVVYPDWSEKLIEKLHDKNTSIEKPIEKVVHKDTSFLYWYFIIVLAASVATGILILMTAPKATITDPFAHEMIRIEGGGFVMGDNFNNSYSLHLVRLSDYYIGRYEVSQTQWEAIMGNNPSNFKGDNLPVEQVSWDNIQVFIKKLNEKTGKQYRLPTEAEWEYAARERGKKVRFGNGKDIINSIEVNFDGRGIGIYRTTTVTVNNLTANSLGLYNMSGNVSEWCSDWYDKNYYDNSPIKDPKGAESGSDRVIRGGSWSDDRDECRASIRGGCQYMARRNYIGFRLAYSSL